MALEENLLNNYIYLYHLDEYLFIPTFPDSITDTMTSSFEQTNALSRSAPVLSYKNSGPRQVQLTLNLHRDMLYDMNLNNYNFKLDIGEDYIDTLINKLQSMALPKYTASSKSVKPPMIAVRFGNEIFIKGVVSGSVSVTYNKPILSDGKYAQVSVAFTVTEVDPYDAKSVATNGSFRGLTSTFKNGILNSNN